MSKSFWLIFVWAGFLWAQDFNNCQNLEALKKRRAVFEAEQAVVLNNVNTPDSTKRRLIAVYESYLNRLYPVMEKELKGVDKAKQFKRIYEQITAERETVLTAIDRLCKHLHGKPTLRLCTAARKYLTQKQFQEDFKTKPAPDFEYTDVRGKKGRLSDFRGRYVLLHFWSMHSVPCVQEIKDLRTAHSQYNARLTIISINTDPAETEWDKETLLNFIRAMHMDWIQIADGRSKRIFNQYHVHNYPTLYLIDANGVAVQPDFILGKELRGERLFKTLAEQLDK